MLRWERAATSRRTLFPFDSITFLWPLLAPTIDTLEVALSGTEDPKFQSFLDNYPQLYPNLKSIKLDFLRRCQVPASASLALSQAICSNADWQRVELSPTVDNVALKHLGTSSTLKVVSLTLAPGPEATQSDETWFGHADTPFRNVTRLALTLENRLDFATHLLRAHDQLFHDFKVLVRTQPTAMEVSALLTAIASPQRMHSLQLLVIRQPPFYGISRPASERQRLSYETFRPLASLAHLCELVINLNHTISLDDDEFAGLVSNWPFLEVLWLMGMREEHPAKSITLKGLLSLLVSCQKLREIGLSVDASGVPLEACTDACCPSVTRLVFQDSPITNSELVAEFLSKHLPCVRAVHAVFTRRPYGEGDRKHEQLWTRVNAWRKLPIGE